MLQYEQRNHHPIWQPYFLENRSSGANLTEFVRRGNLRHGYGLSINTRNLILHLKSLGYPIDDADMATPLYNDNDACVI